MRPGSASPVVCWISMAGPPLKSMPKWKPFVNAEPIETAVITSEKMIT